MIFFPSFDTEALNKKYLPDISKVLIEPNFSENNFTNTHSKKINYGIQQLYTIGIYNLICLIIDYKNIITFVV